MGIEMTIFVFPSLQTSAIDWREQDKCGAEECTWRFRNKKILRVLEESIVKLVGSIVLLLSSAEIEVGD